MATTAATTRLKGAALTLQNSHWLDLLVSSSPLSSLHPSLCAAPARPCRSPPSLIYVTRCWCRLRLPGTHFYTRGCHSILDLGSPRAHPRSPVLVRLWRIVSSPSLGPSGWNSESDQWATRIDDSISTTSRYPFFIAKAPPPSLPADQQEASTESPISEPGTSAQHCWKGEWGICLSSRHRIAVDNPTDHRESAEGDAANLPRESSVSPSFLRPVPAWSMWSQGLPQAHSEPARPS